MADETERREAHTHCWHRLAGGPLTLRASEERHQWVERELRIMWALNHGCEGIYGDDGVLQCKHGDWMEWSIEDCWKVFASIQSQRITTALSVKRSGRGASSGESNG